MAVLFLANNLADVVGSNLVPATSGFDKTLMTSAIATASRSGVINIVFDTEQQEIWHRFRLTTSKGGNAYVVETAIQVYDNGNRELMRMERLGNSQDNRILVYGDTTQFGGYNAFPLDVFLDIHIKFTATHMEIQYFQNGTLVESFNTPKGTKTGIKRIVMTPACHYNAPSTVVISEMMTLTTSTLGLRLASLDVASQGDLTGMVGDVMDLNTFGDGLGLVTNAPNQRRSWNPTAYGGAARPISAVVQTMVAERAGGSPSVLAAFIRKDGLNYDGSNKAIGSYTRAMQVWETNPMNGLPWDTDDLAGLQFGVKSGV